MEDFTRALGEVLGPLLGTGGVVGAFVYFRKYDKELREEVRQDNDSLRAERDTLRTQVDDQYREIERLRAELRERGQP